MTNDPDQAVEQRVNTLLLQLTLKEKVSLLSGRDNWASVPIERLGIPYVYMTDGPHGVRLSNDEAGRKGGPATSFPTGVSIASSWDPDLVTRVGEALGEETLAMGCNILLGPCVNIVRHPLAGRNFEAYSEDPYLAGRIGVAFVKGVQSKGAGTSVKHYAGNNQELERGRGSSEIDERTLREIYLAQFEAIVKEAKPWTVMCSYNRINGVYASQNHHTLTEILKDEWGYQGVVISDWGANHTIVESVEGGLDIEMPGPARYYGQLLVDAVRNWQVDESVIDKAARCVLRMVVRSGKMDNSVPKGSLNTPEHQALARQLAEESIVLLKNERKVLPIQPDKVKSIAVIGPMAAEAAIGGGGSSFLEPPYRVSPLQGLHSRLDGKVTVTYEQGCDNHADLPTIKATVLTPSSGTGHGLLGEYFDNPGFTGQPLVSRIDTALDFWWLNFGPNTAVPQAYGVRWTGKLISPGSGRFAFQINHNSRARLYINGELAIDSLKPASEDIGAEVKVKYFAVLDQGQSYDLRLEFTKPGEIDYGIIKLLFAPAPLPEDDDRMARAVALAQKSDVAVIFAGLPQFYESEGSDRPDMELTGPQNELIQAVARVQPDTVVVVHAGSPVSMPWLADVPAVLEAFYPGQEGGNALARILLGEVNPSGKISVTFPMRLEDTPAFNNCPGGKEVLYGEGVFVGYRHYDLRQIRPLFPFGYGLSYTTFEYSQMRLAKEGKRGEPVQVSLTVKNTGSVAGKEVVQCYVSDLASSLPRPPKELKGFQKVSLAPGESKSITFELNERAFAFYDPYRAQWVVEPGDFEILLGSSSQDIRARAKITLI